MSDEFLKQAELDRMKQVATSLFWIMLFVFVFTSLYHDQYAWVGFVRATAEAAMVGAIADWFAVTALFRHPFGLKIPHTAIIPRRKEGISRGFARFIRNNFLSTETITARLRTFNGAERAARWISQPEHSAQLTNYVMVAVAAAVQVVKDEDVQQLIEQNIESRLRTTQLAPILGNGLSFVVSGKRQQDMLYGLVSLASHIVKENRLAIEEQINKETPWFLPAAVNQAIYIRLVEAIDHMLHEVSTNPAHPIHARFSEAMGRLIHDLKTSPEVIEREQVFKEDLLQHPDVRAFSASLWRDIKAVLLASDSPDIRQPVQQAIMGFGNAILEDQSLQDKINRWLEEGAIYLVDQYGPEVERFISTTISRWDTAVTTHKIELEVGKDLQYIRINGTIVGGIVGFLIHVFEVLLPGF